MKTTYWFSECLTDADCYSVRCKSKIKAKKEIRECGHHRWGPLVKVTVEGPSLFSILQRALSEGGLWEENEATNAALKSNSVYTA